MRHEALASRVGVIEPRLVLGSASPRRRELLGALMPMFEVRPSQADEPVTGRPVLDARDLATAKALAVEAGAGELVLGADTLVARGSTIYGKPVNATEARRMLAELSGRDHLVITGVALARDGLILAVDHSVALVTLRNFTPAEIAGYVQSGRPLDKAGAYAIQDEDVALVDRLTGCYCNVMGLPLWRTAALLRRFGVETADPSLAFSRCAACPERPRGSALQSTSEHTDRT